MYCGGDNRAVRSRRYRTISAKLQQFTIETTTPTEVFFGRNIFADKIMDIENKNKCLIIIDSKVYNDLDGVLMVVSKSLVYKLDAGEKSKSIRTIEKITEFMLENNFDRHSSIIAIGGGVIGDIASMIASLYMRGIKYYNIPTTLLAMVDSSIGGKTAINVGNLKNALGTFYQPTEVIVDYAFLDSLAEKEIISGLGEIIKTSLLDKKLYNKVQNLREKLLIKEHIEPLIADCIKIKGEIVMQDERETNGIRKKLNIGHTAGHMLEMFYKNNSHGIFVLKGLVFELDIANKLGYLKQELKENIESLIFSVIEKNASYKNLSGAIELARLDKKNKDGKISVMAVCDIGDIKEVYLPFDEYKSLIHKDLPF